MPIWSILILTTPRRVGISLPTLLYDLQQQIGDRDVEVLALYDNKKRTVGEKRNALLQIANGKFISFIDDDDEVSFDYVDQILDTIEKNPTVDCISFDELVTIDNKKPEHWKYEINFRKTDEKYHYGRPAHTHVWSSNIIKHSKFPSRNFEEDIVWIDQTINQIKNLININKILYYYNFRSLISETRN